LTDFVFFPGFEVSLFSHNSWIWECKFDTGREVLVHEPNNFETWLLCTFIYLPHILQD
jgi:hypothetical protein